MPDILWSFPGTLSTDQNGNLPRIKVKKATTVSHFDVNLIQAPVGGSTVVAFYKNGAIVATVTIAAGQTFAETAASVSYAVDDLIYAQVQSIAPTTPGVTAAFRARAA